MQCNGPDKTVGGSEFTPNCYGWLAALIRCRDYERENPILMNISDLFLI